MTEGTEGKVDFFYESSTIPMRFEGLDPKDIARDPGAVPMQIVASAHAGGSAYMVRADSPIKTIYDIGPETRFAVGPVGPIAVYALLAWLKLNRGRIPKDPAQGKWNVRIVPCATRIDNLKAVPDGVADVAYVTPDNPLVEEAAEKSPGVRFLELPVKTDREGLARFRELIPYMNFAKHPSGLGAGRSVPHS